MRAARLIRMVLLLQTRRGMTATELAERLEVSERTVARDVLALSEAGIPVYSDRGRGGGYRLLGGYRTRLTGLGRTEVAALFLSGVPTALRDMGLADAASAARLKVSAELRPELEDAPGGVTQRFHLDAPGWWQPPRTPELLAPLADAVWDDRRVTVRYRRQATEVRRVLEPYGLVLKAGVWYAAARVVEEGPPSEEPDRPTEPGDAEAAGRPEAAQRPEEPERPAVRTPPKDRSRYRVYRVDRFTAVAPDEASFERDPDFDLPAFWAERAAAFARSVLRSEVLLRLTPAGARRLRYTVDRASADEAVAAAGPPDPCGRLTLRLPVESEEVAFEQLLMLGPEVEVLEPATLRARCAEAAARTLALYTDGPDGPDRPNGTG